MARRSFLRNQKLRLLLLTFICSASAQAADEHDERFPPLTIKGLQYSIPVDNHEIAERKLAINIDARMPGFSSVLKFTGKKRPLLPERKAKIDLLSNMSQLREMMALYENEIEVEQDSRRYWLPIQKPSESVFEKHVLPGAEFNASIRYIGCCYTLDEKKMNENRLYFLIGFNGDLSRQPKRGSCFSDKLLDVKLGADFQATVKRLTKKYGSPVTRQNPKGGTILQFDLNARKSAQLHIATATADYTEKVFLIQVSGIELSTPVYSSFRLGDPLSRAPNLDLLKLREEPSQNEVRTFFEEGSACSVQTLGDKVYSIQIVEDFNFLSD